MRVPDGEPLRWDVGADVEALTWAPHAPTTFLASTEDGLVCAYDARSGAGSAPLFRLSAHDAATCAMSFNPALPNLMATASTDMKVRASQFIFWHCQGWSAVSCDLRHAEEPSHMHWLQPHAM